MIISQRQKGVFLALAVGLTLVLAVVVYNATFRAFVDDLVVDETPPAIVATDGEEVETPVAEAEVINLAAIQSIVAYQASRDETTIANLKNQLQARRVVLTKAIKKGNLPDVRKYSLSSEQLAAVPVELVGEVEKTTALTGEWRSTHQDLVSSGEKVNNNVSKFVRTKNQRRLIVGGQEYAVYLSREANQPELPLKVGRHASVSIKGAVVLGDNILSEPANIVQTADLSLAVAGPGPNAVAGGVTKVAVVLANFQNNRQQFVSPAVARETMFGTATANTVQKWYERQSFGLNNKFVGVLSPIQGDVFPWVTVNHPANDCSLDPITTKALAAVAADPNARFPGAAAYDVIIVAFPWNRGCGQFAGGANVGGNRIWLVGNFNLRVLLHEMGHIKGLDHANSVKCSEPPLSRVCRSTEYGDPLSVMGHGNDQFGGFHLGTLGYLAPANIEVIGRIGTSTVTLDRLEERSANLQYLRVPTEPNQSLLPIVGQAPQEIQVEYRGQSGKLIIRAATIPRSAAKPHLVSPLSVGDVFEDKRSGVKVKFLSKTIGQATVEVTVTEKTCVRTDPAITVSPDSQVGRGGQALTYDLKVTNNNNRRCQLVELDNYSVRALSTQQLNGWTAVLDKPSVSLPPKETKTLKLTVTPPANAAAGYYEYEAQISRDPLVGKMKLYAVVIP